MLKHFNSLKKRPSELARYVRERVPPALLSSLFIRAPMEADDMAMFLSAIRTSVQEGARDFGPETVADYLVHLLRTKAAETQLNMLSSEEMELLRQLADLVQPEMQVAKGLQKALKSILG